MGTSGNSTIRTRDLAVPPSAARTLVIVPWLVSAALIILSVADRQLYLWLLKEDRPLEWTQFGLFVAAGVLFFRASAAFKNADRLLATACLVIALGLAVVAGEEISWGQRLLGFGTPEALGTVNRQNETTLHNINQGIPVEQLFIWAQMLIGLVGATLCLLAWKGLVNPRTARMQFLTTDPAFVSCFAILFLFRASRAVGIGDGIETYWRFAEWPETAFALVLAAQGYRTLRLARSSISQKAHGRLAVA